MMENDASRYTFLWGILTGLILAVFISAAWYFIGWHAMQNQQAMMSKGMPPSNTTQTKTQLGQLQSIYQTVQRAQSQVKGTFGTGSTSPKK